jgi:hypothetical protein
VSHQRGSRSLGAALAHLADRTGHTTSAMVNRYRRAARSAQELNLGPLAALDAIVPELRTAERSAGLGVGVSVGNCASLPAAGPGQDLRSHLSQTGRGSGHQGSRHCPTLALAIPIRRTRDRHAPARAAGPRDRAQ